MGLCPVQLVRPHSGQHHEQVRSSAQQREQRLDRLLYRPHQRERVSGQIRPGSRRQGSSCRATYFYLNTTQNAYGNRQSRLWDINQSFSEQQNVNISDVHTFSPTTANQGWITFTRVAGGRVNLPQFRLDDLGSNFTIQGPKALPELTVSGILQCRRSSRRAGDHHGLLLTTRSWSA